MKFIGFGTKERNIIMSNNMPWWVTEEEKCIWCFRSAKMVSAFVSEDEKHIEMYYQCDNPKCPHIGCMGKVNKFGIIQRGKTAVEVFIKKTTSGSNISGFGYGKPGDVEVE
jgi:hypothetical protein